MLTLWTAVLQRVKASAIDNEITTRPRPDAYFLRLGWAQDSRAVTADPAGRRLAGLEQVGPRCRSHDLSL